jgi:GNAT superfamily N-acetyltransferase
VDLVVRPLTGELWPALEDLFGAAGASNGCWCMYWRLGPEYHRRPREQNKAALRELAHKSQAPGLLALDGNRAVGWCQVAPRSALPWLDRQWPSGADDGSRVWCVSCFYVRRGYRGRGVSGALVTEAILSAQRAKATALEAYPVDTALPSSSRNTFTGTASTFQRAGFKPIARGAYGRVLMRRDL